MSNTHDKDRWRELADLLGLPPDENKPSGPPAAAPKERRDEPRHEESHHDEVRQREPRRQAWESAPPVVDVKEAEPIAEDSFEPLEEAIRDDASQPYAGPPLDISDEGFERDLAEPVSVEPEGEREATGPDDDSSQERPRRGRRRGRRGNRGDSRDRDDRPRKERAPRADEMPRDIREAPGDSEGSDLSRESADDEGRHFPGERERSSEDAEEDVFETSGTAAPHPIEEDDDEEVDKLTDWNVPSWAELISSLYRPER